MSRSAPPLLTSSISFHNGQRRPSRTQVARSPSSVEEGGLDDSDNEENAQGIEEARKSKKRGPELLRDALEAVSNKRLRRLGIVKYVLSNKHLDEGEVNVPVNPQNKQR